MDTINNNPDKSKLAAAVFDKYAKEYRERFGDTAPYHESFDVFCIAIKEKDPAILELACGPGNITCYLMRKRPDFRILATDLAPNMLDVARELNPGVEFRLMDCRDLLTTGRKFNGIVLGFCLPYVSKEETKKLFSDAHSILLPGGAIYISTMEDDYSKSGPQKGSKGDEIFMHFYTEELLTTLLQDTGFKIKWTQRKITLDSVGKEVTDLLMIAVLNNKE